MWGVGGDFVYCARRFFSTTSNAGIGRGREWAGMVESSSCLWQYLYFMYGFSISTYSAIWLRFRKVYLAFNFRVDMLAIVLPLILRASAPCACTYVYGSSNLLLLLFLFFQPPSLYINELCSPADRVSVLCLDDDEKWDYPILSSQWWGRCGVLVAFKWIHLEKDFTKVSKIAKAHFLDSKWKNDFMKF